MQTFGLAMSIAAMVYNFMDKKKGNKPTLVSSFSSSSFASLSSAGGSSGSLDELKRHLDPLDQVAAGKTVPSCPLPILPFCPRAAQAHSCGTVSHLVLYPHHCLSGALWQEKRPLLGPDEEPLPEDEDAFPDAKAVEDR